ncbi:hypothetical protein FB384_002470 [Prauserella sediminis]|uniref:Uncharacterized protein n=1 Tax=Prauserella sediminis TaxID=577680 RepID=A0A839XU76_9PSEU|nr:hypothetical protein [Prauserella sediminis]MBB3663566.1 hypothetical protein [Prauserella sediminis]
MTGENEIRGRREETRWDQLRRQHRFTPALVIALVVLTLFNGYALVASIVSVADEFEHGRELDDLSTQLGLLALAEAVVCLSALAAVWLRQMRGVHIYVGAKAVVLVIAVALAPEAITMFVMVPLLLGGVLWVAASQAGWRADGFGRPVEKA